MHLDRDLYPFPAFVKLGLGSHLAAAAALKRRIFWAHQRGSGAAPVGSAAGTWQSASARAEHSNALHRNATVYRGERTVAATLAGSRPSQQQDENRLERN